MLASLALLALSVVQEPVWFATTQDGLRVESSTPPKVGDFAITTPFGMLDCALDPVAKVEAKPPRPWQKWLQSQPAPPLLSIVEEISRRGELTELAHLTDFLLKEHPNSETLRIAVHRMESWGSLLDPLPSRTALDKRIPALWNQVGRKKTADAFYLGGRMEKETLAQSGGERSARGLTVSEVSRALRNKSPFVRRTAVRVAGKEEILEVEVLAKLLFESLQDDLLIADAAAEAATRTWGGGARLWWTQVLRRADPSPRLRAAQAMARYQPEFALRPILFVLSASGKKSGARYKFDGKEILIVNQRLEFNLQTAVAS